MQNFSNSLKSDLGHHALSIVLWESRVCKKVGVIYRIAARGRASCSKYWICANKMLRRMYYSAWSPCCVKYKNISNHSRHKQLLKWNTNVTWCNEANAVTQYVVCCIIFRCIRVLGESEGILILYNQALWNMLSHSNSMTLHWQHALASNSSLLLACTQSTIAVC